jgi:Domain of unknown function (DUF4942)
MFSEDFYPTPKSVARKMLEPYTQDALLGRAILEPSAGKGDLADVIAQKMGDGYNEERQRKRIFCLEADMELRMVLTGKEYKVIGEDFLTYKKHHLFDLIVMNPPFSNGAAHLLKAWEVLNGGDIVCLLNTETLSNPYTAERKLLKEIVEANGTVEDLGQCFTTAVRTTHVNVSLIRLHKKKPEVTFDFFENKTTERPLDGLDFTGENLPALRDVFGNLETSYDCARAACADVLRARNRLEYYLNAIYTACTGDELGDLLKETEYNEMVEMIKEKAWSAVFARTKLSEVMTEKVRHDFDTFRKENGGLDFTKENILGLLETLFMNRGAIMQQCILDAFDKLTAYDKQNRVHVEGWKTNDAWKVNRKIIIPWGAERRIGYDSPGINYSRDGDLADIEKALCFIDGAKFEGYRPSIRTRIDQGGFDWGEWAESRFFNFKLYKKGTIHLYFRDERIWSEFNIRAAGYKKWLPDDYNNREKGGNDEKAKTTQESRLF